MRKDLPPLSDFLPRTEEPSSELMELLLIGAAIFFNTILYVVLFLLLVYVIAYQPDSFKEGQGVYLMLFCIGFLFSLFVAKDLLQAEIVIEIEDEEKFTSLLNTAIFKMNFESKRKLESEGIFEFKPSDWMNGILEVSHIHVQLVREGKAIISGPKDDIDKLRNMLKV